MDSFAVDDTVAAALAALTGESLEHIGVIYQDGDTPRGTPPQSSGKPTKVKANVIIPKGSLLALYHNHPESSDRRSVRRGDVGGGEAFSEDDRLRAKRLGVPSYILTPSRRVLKFDPKSDTVTEVLALFDLSSMRTAGAHNTLSQ